MPAFAATAEAPTPTAPPVKPLDGATPLDPSEIPLPYVVSTVNHHVPNGERPRVNAGQPRGDEPTRTAEYAPYAVRIHDARPIADALSLDEQGFALVDHDTRVTDFYDDDEVTRVYYPEVEALVKAQTGAAKVVIFDHTTRADAGPDGDRKSTRAPVRTVHNDYTDKSGPQRVRDLLPPDEAEAWLQGRFAVINVWRPISDGPVERSPLAVADARSMTREDFIEADLVYEDRVGEIFDVAATPDQRWYYVPRMERDEAILLKCFDSDRTGPARFTAHTAFDDPTTQDDAPPRESIEVRTLVLFPPDGSM